MLTGAALAFCLLMIALVWIGYRRG
jgi:hypothetical protein